MKQISLKKIIELGGYLNNNHLANAIINHLDDKAKFAEFNGFNASANAYRKASKALYDELDKLGYWEED